MKQELQHKTIISELSLRTETTEQNIMNTFSNKTPLNTNNNSITNYESTRNVSISGIITPTCKLTKEQNNPINTIYYYPKKIVLKKRALLNYKQTNNVPSNKNYNINEHKDNKETIEHNNNDNMSNPPRKKQTILSKIILLKHNEKKDKKEIINKGSFIYQRKKSLDKCISHKQKANRTFNDEPKNTKHTHSLNTISYNDNITNTIKNQFSKENNAPSSKKHTFNKKMQMQMQTSEMFSIESKDNSNSTIKQNKIHNKTCFTNVCEACKNIDVNNNKTHLRTKTPSSMATTPKDLMKTFDQYSNSKNNNISLNTSSTQTPRYTLHKLPKNLEYLHETDNLSSLSSCVLTPKHSDHTSTNVANSNNFVSNTTLKTNNNSLYNSLHSSHSIITTSNTYYGHKPYSSLLRVSVPINNNYNASNINNECKTSSVILPTRNISNKNKQYTISSVINDNNDINHKSGNVNISSNSDFIKTLRNKLASNSFRNKHEQSTSLFENKNNLNTKYKQHICNSKQRSISNHTTYNYNSNEIMNLFRETTHNNIPSYTPSNYYFENGNEISSVKKQYCLHSTGYNVDKHKGNTSYFNELKSKPSIYSNNNNGSTNAYTQYMANQNKNEKKHRDYNSFIVNQSNRVKLDSYLDCERDIQNKRKMMNKYSLSFINNFHNHCSTLTGTSLIYDYDKIGKELSSK